MKGLEEKKPIKKVQSKFSRIFQIVAVCFIAIQFFFVSLPRYLEVEPTVDYKDVFLNALETNLAGNWSKIYTSVPHLAGTGKSLVNFTRDKFEEYGLKATVDDYEILVSYPKDHDLNLIDSTTGEILYKAPLKEDVLEEDPTTQGNDTIPTFLGYAANGNVTAQYVYANYGTKDDFETLKELGVDVTGKIAVVRYGGIFRGLKVKFAQDNGAIGVLIYSDPGDDGEMTTKNGYEQYPKGPARQESSVQRGSVQFLGGVGAYPGDPTTPGYASKPGCERQDPHKAIGKIPVLPISYREVTPILKKLNGHGVKLSDKKWIGDLDGFDYYTGPNKKAELNLYNNQDFNISTLSNVYGEIEGEKKDEVIIIGNHRDAWIKGGAGDPNSGSASMMEIARGFGELIKAGYKFKRTIILMSWDGEEYGLLGSTEYGEFAAKMLQKKVVAYLNVDVSVSGTDLNLEGCKSIYGLIKKVAATLPYPGAGSLLDHYLSKHGDKITALGSGSDYTVFLEHLGIPSIDMGFGGGKNAPIYHYHSNYDSYHWMAKYGDKGFVFHNLAAKLLGLIALELNDQEVISFGIKDYVDDLVKYFEIVKSKIPKEWESKEIKSEETWNELLVSPVEEMKYVDETTNGWYKDRYFPFPELMGKSDCMHHKNHMMYDVKKHKHLTLNDIVQITIDDLAQLSNSSAIFDGESASLQNQHEHRDSLFFWQRLKLHYKILKHNKLMQYFERNFIHEKGLHEREWFKHIIFASGRFTGYAGQVYPMLQEAIEDGDFDRLVKSLGIVSKTLRRVSDQLVI